MTLRFGSLLLVAALSLAGQARGDDFGEERQRSFFFRFAYGPAWGSANAAYGRNAELDLNGPGTAIDIAFGVALTDRLAVHAQFFGSQLPDLVDTGHEPDFDAEKENALTIDTDCLGVGLTVRWPRLGLYGALTGGMAHVKYGNRLGSLGKWTGTNVGWAASALLGRDWPIRQRWRVGVAAQFNAAGVMLPNEDHYYYENIDYMGDLEDDLNVFTGALMFSATYW